MNLAPGSVTALATPAEPYKVHIEQLDGDPCPGIVGDHPVVAWAVVCDIHEDGEPYTTVEPVFLCRGVLRVLGQFLDNPHAMFDVDVLPA
ncbi:hypothetical protein [Nonomuraea sp. NPDC049646]|uniref:hypothetical protein n=1 Tax=unclassified Nonomuraea TaxID=2593643 RepID=UPI00378FF197